MGQTDSKTSIPEVTFKPKVEIIGTKNLGYFGEVQVAKEKDTNVQLYVKKYNYYNKEEFDKQLAHCHLRQSNPHPNLINIIGYKSAHKTAYCAEHYSITIYLETVEDTLEEKLTAHIKSGNFISEIELQLLAEQLISILAESQNKEIAHGDIRPGTLFFTEEAYKMADSSFDALTGASAFIKHAVGEKTLYAPEVLKVLNGESEDMSYNKYKADVFSLGATLLSLATLTKSEELYKIETNEVNVELLEARIKAAENVYSTYFTTVLRTLLEVNPAARPDFCQLVGRFTIASALKEYHLRSEYERLTGNTPYVKIARTILGTPAEGGYYALIEEIVAKSLKQSQVSEFTPEKSGFQTQYATPDVKVIAEQRKKSGSATYLEETPLKTSQVVSRA